MADISSRRPRYAIKLVLNSQTEFIVRVRTPGLRRSPKTNTNGKTKLFSNSIQLTAHYKGNQNLHTAEHAL